MYLLKHARPGSYILNDTICKVINVHMNIHGLIREVSGPRPLCRVVGILSPNRTSGVTALRPFRSETGQPSRL